MSITIAPVRLVCIVVIILILWPLAFLASLFRSSEDLKIPIKGWRLMKVVILYIVRYGLFFCAGFYRVKIYGKEDSDVKLLALAPHRSFLDSLGIVYLNFASVLTRAGTEKIPLLGSILKLTQPLIVDREEHSSRVNVIKKIFDRVNSPHNWPKLAIFPEGAFLAGVPVQPVCFVYKTSHIDNITWTWLCPSAWIILWLTLCKVYSTFEIHYLPVYCPNKEEKFNAELFANNVRLKMSKYLQLPLSDYSFDDARLMGKFEAIKLPMQCGLITVTTYLKKFHIKLDAIFQIVPIYAKLAESKLGIVNFRSFMSFMNMAPNESMRKLFNLFDKHRNGYFKFKEFVETYFEVILPELRLNGDQNTHIEFISMELGLTSDAKKYTYTEFNKILMQKLNVEFRSFEEIDVNYERVICKRDLVAFLQRSPLHWFHLSNRFNIVFMSSRLSKRTFTSRTLE